ncbi:RpiB/LacA/LacB family sugar-phosphate isomerase [Rickettsiales bacterium LUAb2]
MQEKIIIASDHRGFNLKEFLVSQLPVVLDNKFQVIDTGVFSPEKADYPLVTKTAMTTLESENAKFGILICGSGIGVSIAANRFKFVRAALVHNKEFACLARKHNNANVICLPSDFLTYEQSLDIVKTFINTEFLGEHHQIRVDQLSEL